MAPEACQDFPSGKPALLGIFRSCWPRRLIPVLLGWYRSQKTYLYLRYWFQFRSPRSGLRWTVSMGLCDAAADINSYSSAMNTDAAAVIARWGYRNVSNAMKAAGALMLSLRIIPSIYSPLSLPQFILPTTEPAVVSKMLRYFSNWTHAVRVSFLFA